MAKSTLVRQLRDVPAGPIEVSIDSLIQGVSQQPSHLRVVGQGEEQINGWSSPVQGLCKRNALRLVGKTLPTPVTDFYLEMMSVVAGERYSVMLYPDGNATRLLITLNGVAANIDLHGTGMTAVPTPLLDPLLRVAATGVSGDNTSYIYNAAGSYEQKYVLINNGPIAFLLNRQQTVAMDSTLSSTAKNEGLIFVQAAAYEVTYTVTLDGNKLPSFTTPKATDTNNQLSTSAVATALAAEVNKVAGFTATVERYIVHVKKADGSAFTMSVDDGRGNSMARAVKDQVVSLAELPVLAPNGFVVKVASDPSVTTDDRYLKFTTNTGVAFGDGAWAETVKPGITYKLNVNTMPLVIYRAARGVLFVGPADGATRTMTVNGQGYTYTFPSWGQRTAGDEKTVPSPDFIGKQIRDHIIFRGRYVVAAGQNVVFSESNDVFNFFQDTSVAITSKDPFSVLAVSEVSSTLEWLLPIDETVLVFSKYSQFQIRAADADVLTASTAIILRLSNLEMNIRVRPKLAGPQVLFATEEFGFTHFREYSFYDTPQRRVGLNLGGSGDICASVPKYINGYTTHWDVGETIDMMVCSTPTDRKTLYVYKYLFNSTQQGMAKSQASWSKWTFGGDVRWMKFMDNELWLVLTYPDGTYTAHITNDELDDPTALQVRLDRLLLYPDCNADPQTTNDVTATYDAETNVTTFTLPYAVSGETHAVIRYVNPTKEGLLLGSTSSGNQIVCSARGDWRGQKVAFGEAYQFSYEFSRMYVPARDQARQRMIGKQDGRTQLLRLSTFHYNTGRYNVRVKRTGHSADTVHKFRARNLNVANNRIGTEVSHVETGTYRVPLYCQNSECRIFVESDSWLPVVITGASWEGAYSNRSKGAN